MSACPPTASPQPTPFFKLPSMDAAHADDFSEDDDLVRSSVLSKIIDPGGFSQASGVRLPAPAVSLADVRSASALPPRRFPQHDDHAEDSPEASTVAGVKGKGASKDGRKKEAAESRKAQNRVAQVRSALSLPSPAVRPPLSACRC